MTVTSYVPMIDIQTTCEGAAPLEHMGLNLRLLYTCGDYKLDFDSKCALDVHSMDLEHGEVFTVCLWMEEKLDSVGVSEETDETFKAWGAEVIR